MKRAQRDTTVFSLSALDLFCSAMGVFMVLCFIALPSFSKISSAPPAPASPPAPQPEPNPPPPVVLACILVSIEWKENNDVDLHVVDPDGRHFYYRKKEYADSKAILTQDSMQAGKEIWVHPKAIPGDYKIYCNLFQKNVHQPSSVSMMIMTAAGREVLPPIGLSNPDTQGMGKLIATVSVHADSSVRVTRHF